MAILIGFLTFILVLTALFLILLVLVQLPKKEAGAAMAFGGGMSEVLLGAGSGTVLTKITKYAVVIFLALSLVLSILISYRGHQGGLGVTRAIEEKARTATPTQTQPPQAPSTFQPLPTTNPVVGTVTTGAPALLIPATNTAPPLAPAPLPTNPPPNN
jgi:preprotein translocase subunit SecG